MRGHAQGLYVVTNPFMTSHRVRIHTLALSMRLPTMHGMRDYVEVGGLMSYGASFPDAWRRAGDYVNKVLRGAKPPTFQWNSRPSLISSSIWSPPRRSDWLYARDARTCRRGDRVREGFSGET